VFDPSGLQPVAGAPLRIGVDAGGTFTDFVAESPDGSLSFLKLPSTPRAPAEAVVVGVRSLASGREVASVAHGSTVATNAFLEGRGARVGFLTHIGLEDVLAIGRQNRRGLYRLDPTGARRLVDAELVRGIAARVGADGETVEPLDPAELARAAGELRAAGAEVLVLAFLHSARHPELERRAETLLGGLGIPVVSSHRVTAEPREYERWATAVVDASLAPVVRSYVADLASSVPGSLRIMLSNGGLATAKEASAHPVATILSGPVAGVVGARLVAREAGFENLVTFDMGGTSCDVALVPGEPLRTTETEIDGVPIRLPLVDIQTVGAGGGSIARVDHAGALAVGPASAGAEPGPACYGLGGVEPTVTDAHLLLGHLDAERFLGGRRPLHPERATDAILALARRLDADPAEAAMAILALARSHLERAVRRVTLERGYEPAHFTLVAYGGAGGLHAAELAAALRAGRILVPRAAGVLSALGCLAADTRLDFARAVLAPTEGWEEWGLEALFDEMEEEARRTLEREGVPPARRTVSRALAMRYRGQSYEVEVPVPAAAGGLARDFHDHHERRYGYARPDAPTEIVAARVVAIGATRAPRLPDHAPAGPSRPAARRIALAGGEIMVPAWRWDDLPVDHRSDEPAVVFGDHASALVPPDWSWLVDRRGNLVLEAGPR
jgi:N-methylhydantoinase A